ETLGGVMTRLIERNTTIPTSKSQIFSTAADNQTSVEINVVQGEREMAADNKTLGRFILDGIPPSPRGVPQVEVSFDIDANGILNVSAKEKTTGKEQKITITASTSLSDQEVQRMTQEAELHAEEDKKKRELIEAKNNAESLVYQAEKVMKEHGEKVPEDIRTAVQEKIDALKALKEGTDAPAIAAASDQLNEVLSKVGEAMYKTDAATQAAPGAEGTTDSAQANPESGAQGQANSDAVDAEFTKKAE
ncbi:MAG: Hsp70 family protein, partial [Patescibacteria group bacterium]